MDGRPTVVSTEAARPPSPLARLARVAVVLLLVFGVTFSMPSAFADIAPSVPIAIGEGEAGAGAAAEGLAACAATTVAAVGCVAATALVIGLFQTRDTWVPVVKSFLTSSLAPILGNQPGTCAMTDSVTVGTGNNNGGFTASWTSSGGGCPSPPAAARIYSNGSVICKNNSTGAVTSVSPGGYYGDPFGPANGSATFYPCGNTGFSVVFVSIALNIIATDYSFAFGGPSASAGVAPPDSMLSQTTTVPCTLPDGSVKTISKTQQGQPGEYVMPSCQQAYPGSIPGGGNVSMTSGWPGREQQILTLPLKPKTTLQSNFPGCFDSSGAFLSATCQTHVWINGQQCHVGVGHCANWTSAAQDYGDSVSCQFGVYAVPVSECMQYLKNAYVAGAATQDLTRLDASGTPVDATATSAVAGTGDAAATASSASTFSCPALNLSWTDPIGDILGSIKAGLCWAFVPVGAPSWAALSNPIPPGWLPSFASLGDGSCGPITMPSMAFFLHGHSMPTQSRTIVDTCSPPWPTVRNVTYYGLEVVAFVTIGRRIFFSIMTAFGMAVDNDLSGAGADLDG